MWISMDEVKINITKCKTLEIKRSAERRCHLFRIEADGKFITHVSSYYVAVDLIDELLKEEINGTKSLNKSDIINITNKIECGYVCTKDDRHVLCARCMDCDDDEDLCADYEPKTKNGIRIIGICAYRGINEEAE